MLIVLLLLTAFASTEPQKQIAVVRTDYLDVKYNTVWNWQQPPSPNRPSNQQ